mmetsp:Transcript_153668/g.491358  ORF Transcript_153668/g.491358 Transcript_153668/m.491358 type:complete len:249 (-) Transcript_153668:1169-1915(-)
MLLQDDSLLASQADRRRPSGLRVSRATSGPSPPRAAGRCRGRSRRTRRPPGSEHGCRRPRRASRPAGERLRNWLRDRCCRCLTTSSAAPGPCPKQSSATDALRRARRHGSRRPFPEPSLAFVLECSPWCLGERAPSRRATCDHHPANAAACSATAGGEESPAAQTAAAELPKRRHGGRAHPPLPGSGSVRCAVPPHPPCRSDDRTANCRCWTATPSTATSSRPRWGPAPQCVLSSSSRLANRAPCPQP